MSKADMVNVLAPIVTGLIAWVGLALRNYIAAHTKNEFLKGALIRLDDTILAVVREIEQTVIIGLKAASADGVVTPEEIADIKKQALDTVRAHLGPKGLADLAKVFGLEGTALDAFISTKIEAAVHSLHAEAPAVDPSSPSPAA